MNNITENKVFKTLVAAVVVVAVLVYLQVINFEFIAFDESDCITKNPNIQNGFSFDSFAWALTSLEGVNWHPVTWITHMMVSQFFGMNPGAHHFTNVIFHVASSVLLLLLFYKITGCKWQSFFCFSVFALHPLHVESVAWVAERKDVLSALFWFLTLLCYSRYVKEKKRSWYILAIISFAMGLMSKAMIVTMPLTMVLLDFWPLDRFQIEEGSKRKEPKKRQESGKQRLIYLLVIEKLPFYILSLFTGIMAVYAQHQEGAIRSLEEASFLLRLENAFIAYCKYVVLTFWPHDLAVLYPMPTSFPAWEIGFSAIAFCLVSMMAIKYRQRFPYVTFGWCWFVITLLPVIGILQFGMHSMADRYLYIPMVGILVIVAWGMGDLVKNLKYKGALLSVQAALIILVMTVLTFRQVHFWKNDFYLFRHALDVTEGNPICNNMLGVAFMEAGEVDLAIKQFGQAAAVNHKYTTALNNLGVAYYKKGLYDEAIAQFQESIRLDPDDQRTYLILQKVMHKKTFPK